MTKEQEFFIELLSSHINGYIPKPQENIDWKEIFELSNKHNVTAIVATQIKLLPESSRVQGKGKSYFNQFLGKTLQSYDEKIEAYNYFVKTLSENGIKHLIVKGAVLRDIYPVKELRTSGDTDVVIQKQDYEKCKEILLSNGFTLSQDTGEELDMYYNGQYFEINNTFEYINDETKRFFENPFDERLSYCEGYTYYLYPIYHLVYVLYHILKHIKNGGAGVRMLLDICVLFNNYSIDVNEFLKIMTSLNLEKSSKTIISICKKLFKLDVELEYAVNEDIEEKLIDTIISGGVFGFSNGNLGVVRLASTMSDKATVFSSIKAFLGMFIISKDYLMKFYPYARRHRILLPVAYFNRLFNAVFKRGKRNIGNIQSIFSKNNDNAVRLGEILNELEIK